MPSPRDFGVVGGADETGYATALDDTAAWQAYFDHCVEYQLPMVVDDEIVSRIGNTLTIAPDGYILPPDIGVSVGLRIDLGNVTFVYAGTRDRIVLDIGSSGNGMDHAEIVLPSVVAKGAPAWPMDVQDMLDEPADYVDTAIRLRRVRFGTIHQRLVYGFSKGIEFSGCAWNRIIGAHVYDCRFGRVWTTEGPDADASHCNENLILGGRSATTSSAALLGDAYGEVLTWDKDESDRGHNNNRFYGVCYELGQPGGAAYRVPVRMDGVGFRNFWDKARQENCKGPFAICDGGLPDPVYATANEFEVGFNSSGAPQGEYVLQVNGAYGNLYTGYGSGERHWHSGDLRRLLTSNGGADAPYIGGEMFFLKSDGAPVRALDYPGQVATARDAIHLIGCGVFTAVDTNLIKTFHVALAAKLGFDGQIFLCAFNAAGARLTEPAPDATWGDEPYVKGFGLSPHSSYGGGYTVGHENFTAHYTFTARKEVAKVYVGYIYGGHVLAAQSLSLIGYSTLETESYAGALAFTGLRPFADVDDPGTQPLATAKPSTAGTHGYYVKGERIGNMSAAASAPGGWVCTTSGWLAAAWAGSTVYEPAGRIVTNNSGKMYELVTAGTSAASGGPTGTGTASAWAASTPYAADAYRSNGGKVYRCTTAGTSAASPATGPTGYGAVIADGTCVWTWEPDGVPIVDGTCTWKYIGVKAAFATEANLT